MKMQAHAHSLPHVPKHNWHRLAVHLADVANLSAERATKFDAAEWARAAGLLHDLGKYSREFQEKLEGRPRQVGHSTIGAQVAVDRYGLQGRLLAYVIAGHHAGLANGTGAESPRSLAERLSPAYVSGLPEPIGWEHEVERLLPAGLNEPFPLRVVARDRIGFGGALFTRMLFSALVDADRLDTEVFYLTANGAVQSRGQWSGDLEGLRSQLDNYLASLSQQARASGGDVNTARAEILANVRKTATERPGLFSLTVPTGGGKTLASLAFALDHAAQHGHDRVIYVIPFTSIIEQTAAVFRAALEPHDDCVIEHHSAVREVDAYWGESERQSGERARLATENWDAPIIVTTAVQFFESLFANRTSPCRKLHNVANSVVILDEAQTLPLHLLRPCVAVLDELARGYNSTIVLCTATQPAILATRPDGTPGFKGGLKRDTVRELAPAPKQLYERLARVTVRKPIKIANDDELVRQFREHERVLCIVGTRRHARELFQKARDALPDGVYHLSASLCPVHRSQKLDKIKLLLKSDDAPCRLIATTVIEAGVDVDFPAVYRAMAGLDSIAQAAGRCNREGRRPREDSIVQPFEMADRSTIPELRKYEDAARRILDVPKHADDPLSLQAIEAYFAELYWKQETGREDGLDPCRITDRETYAIHANGIDIPFATIAREFQMIKSDMESVIIPFDELVRDALAELEGTEHVRAVARRFQPYMVNVPREAFVALRSAARIEPVAEHRLGEQFMRLTDDGFDNLYDDDIGLDWSDASYRRVESLIF
ncbi:MAG: CRISPR-associated helicase Cas3' [Pseudomonadota bacterium]